MKKHPLSLLIVITVLFVGFTLGFFLGRNGSRETIQVSVANPGPLYASQRETTQPEQTQGSETKPVITFPIDINAAAPEELTALPGIGQTLAQRICDHRSRNGPFSSPEELMNVEGIGTGKLEKILDLITVGG